MLKVKLKILIYSFFAGAILFALFKTVSAAWEEPTIGCSPPDCNRPAPMYKQTDAQEGPLNIKDVTLGSGLGKIEANKICLCSEETGNCTPDKCITNWSSQGLWTKDPVTAKIYYNTANVGIGTTDPAEKLEIVTGARSVLSLKGDSIADWVGTVIKDTSSNEKWFVGANGNKLLFRRNGATNDLVIDGSGNVGIGTTAPGAKLEVGGGNGASVSIKTDGYVEDVRGIVGGNYVSSHSWTIGTGGAGIFGQNGTTAENERIWDMNPHNVRSIIWRVPSNDATSDADGGWDTSAFSIDKTKTYRVSVWIKRMNSMNGSTYFGIRGNNITYLNGTIEGNPYFFCGGLPELNKWYLLVGYVHGNGDSSTAHYGGMYDGVTGRKVGSFNGGGNCSSDYKFDASATYLLHRTYLYYSTDVNAQQYWWDPRVEEVNGQEPTIEAMLGLDKGATQDQVKYFGGKVGIGVANPSSILNIKAPTDTEGLRIISSNYSPFVIRNSADNADIFRVDQSGNLTITGNVSGLNIGGWTKGSGTIYATDVNDKVGIGTTAPAGKLHVTGATFISPASYTPANIPAIHTDLSDTALFVPTASGGNLDLRLYIDDDAADRFSIWGNSCGGGGCQNLANSSEVAQFRADGGIYLKGNVGIGTNAPSAQLNLADVYSAGGRNLLIGDDTFLTDIDVANTLGIYGNQDNTIASLKFGSGGGTISGYNNNIGIGTVTPQANMAVKNYSGDPGMYGTNVPGLFARNAEGTPTFNEDFPTTWSRVGIIGAGVQGPLDGGTTAIGIAGFAENSTSGGNAIGGFFKAGPKAGIGDAGANFYGIYSVAAKNYFSGNVGIGTVSPAAKLQVNPPTDTEGLRIISSNYSPFIIRNSANNADIFRVDQSGNLTITGNVSGLNIGGWTKSGNNLYATDVNDKVGIGTNAPAGKLHVTGATFISPANYVPANIPAIHTDLSDTALFVPTASGGNLDLRLYIDDDANDRFSIWGNSCGGGGCQNLANSSEVAQFRADGGIYLKGNVGIGLSTPLDSKLTIGGFNGNHLSLLSGNTDWGWKIDTNDAGGGDVPLRVFKKNAGSYSEVMRINQNGNVGIGTSNPGALLNIADIYASGGKNLLIGDDTFLTDVDVANMLGIYGNQDNTIASLKFGSGGGTISGYNNNIGIGTAVPAGKLNIDNGDLIYTNGTYYGAWRYGAKLSSLAGLKGRQINRNTDFLEGVSTYSVYDNGGSGSISLSLLDDTTSPNTSGRVMKIDHTNSGAPSPGWGGFYKAFSKCAGISTGECYREGNRIVYRIWAKIPAGYAINFASNAYGTGGNYTWTSSQSGTGNWEEYIAVQTIGSGGSFSSTGFWYIGGSTRPFTWYVASVDIIDVDQPADVDRASELNIGYKKDVVLGTGNLLTTNSAYLAADGGNVGIGTVSPSAKLQVNPPTDTEGLRIISSNYSPFIIRNSANNADIFRVDQSGNLTITGNVSGLNIGGWTKSGNNLYATDVNDKVGIGTASPNAKLTVISSGAFDQFSLVNSAYYSGGWARGADMQFIKNDSSRHRGLAYGILGGGNDLNGAYFSAIVDDGSPWNTAQLFLNANGNVGIGTNAPTQKLDVAGNAIIGSGGAGYAYLGNRGYYIGDDLGGTDIQTNAPNMYVYEGGWKRLLREGDTITASGASSLTYTDNRIIAPNEYIHNAMHFGFTSYNNNNTSPWADFMLLNSYGDASGGKDNLLVVNRSTDFGIRLYQQAWNSGTAFSSYKDVVLADNGAQTNYLTKYTNVGNALSVGNSTIYDNGNIGIRTSTPGYSLHIVDDNSTGVLNIENDGGSLWTGTRLARGVNEKWFVGMSNADDKLRLRRTGSSDDLVIDTNGNVGIGTNAPGEKLDVAGSLKVARDGRVEVNRGRLGFSNGMGDWNHVIYNDYDNIDGEGSWDGMKMNVYNGLNVRVGNNGATSALYIDSIGKVGIGTTAPSEKLEVAGNTKITGNLSVGGTFSAAGADLAEEFTTKEEIEKGTVLIMGDDGYKSAKPCDSEYDTKVIGVVSDNAAVIMGHVDSEHKAVVTISGVVTVKVSAKNGIIKKGDLLTTSDIGGYAMKAIDAKIGTVIGKALEECSIEKCKIKALINLQ